MNRPLPSSTAATPARLQGRPSASAKPYPSHNARPTPLPAPEFTDGAPLVHAKEGERCFPWFPARLHHLLVVSDLTPASQPALEFALERVGCFPMRVTLVHAGGPTQPSAASVPEEWDRARLLCLFWETQRRHPDASVCMALHRRPEQILAAAAALQADLIVLPQPVLQAFTHLILRAWSGDRLQGSPCPAVVVDAGSRGPRHS